MSTKFSRLSTIFEGILDAQLLIPAEAVFVIVAGTSFFSTSLSITIYENIKTFPATPGGFELKTEFRASLGHCSRVV